MRAACSSGNLDEAKRLYQQIIDLTWLDTGEFEDLLMQSASDAANGDHMNMVLFIKKIVHDYLDCDDYDSFKAKPPVEVLSQWIHFEY